MGGGNVLHQQKTKLEKSAARWGTKSLRRGFCIDCWGFAAPSGHE